MSDVRRRLTTLAIIAAFGTVLVCGAAAGERPAKGPALASVEGKHLILEASPENLKHLKNPKEWIGKLDAAYLAYRELVGAAPYRGKKITVREVAAYPGGWAVAGNPIKWHKPYLKRTFMQINKGDWSFGILHELGHDFDLDYRWVWEPEFFANLKMVYVVETLKANVHQERKYYHYAKEGGPRLDGYYASKARRRKSEEILEDWYGHNDAALHHFLQIRKKTGWDPFKATFREYNKLGRKDLPKGAVKKFGLFAHYLDKFSENDLSVEFIRRGFPVIEVRKGDYLTGINALKERLAVTSHRGVAGRNLKFECRLAEASTFKKGLGTHARSDIVYDLGGQYRAFEACVGVDAATNRGGSVSFEVWADGKKTFQTGKMTGRDIARPVKLSVAGVRKLRLVVGDAGDSARSDWADWADARLVRKNGAVTYLSALKPDKASQGWGRLGLDRSVGGRPIKLEVPSTVKATMTARVGKREFVLKGPDKDGVYRTTISGLGKGRHAAYVTAKLADGKYVLHATAIIHM